MFTQFDTFVSVITLIYVTLGFFRGAIKSILGLVKWYGAGVLTIMFYPKVKDFVGHYIESGMILNGVTVVATYLVVLIAISIVISIFVSALGSTVGGGGDKLLGALVGLTIGVIIASTAHFLIRVYKNGEDPDWLKAGKTYQITSQGADKLQGYFNNIIKNMGKDLGFVKDIDPSGSLQNQLQNMQMMGSEIDMEKLKEAIRMMKEQGMSPEQIKDMINIQDYIKLPQGTINNLGKDMQNLMQNSTKDLQNSLPKPAGQ